MLSRSVEPPLSPVVSHPSSKASQYPQHLTQSETQTRRVQSLVSSPQSNKRDLKQGMIVQLLVQSQFATHMCQLRQFPAITKYPPYKHIKQITHYRGIHPNKALLVAVCQSFAIFRSVQFWASFNNRQPYCKLNLFEQHVFCSTIWNSQDTESDIQSDIVTWSNMRAILLLATVIQAKILGGGAIIYDRFSRPTKDHPCYTADTSTHEELLGIHVKFNPKHISHVQIYVSFIYS